MGRSIARLPEPGAPPSTGERRRRVRQKLHTPVYASFNGPQTGIVVDLSELLDLSEDGFAVQTAIIAPPVAIVDSPLLDSNAASAAETAAEPIAAELPAPRVEEPQADRLRINQHVSLCLDFPETKSLAHGAGQVIWCDDTGRAGIRFASLAPEASQALRQWLFSNLLIGCANHTARKDQLASAGRHEVQSAIAASAIAAPEVLSAATPVVEPEPSPTGAVSHRAELLSALDELRNQIRKISSRQVSASAEDVAGETSTDRAGAILQLITERAVALTGATGAALALEDNGGMICRARAGNPAPMLGSHVDISQGVSGECVRTVRPILCHDTSADRRVDPELCSALGLGSFLAVPVVSDFRVVGLFEVFSPTPRAFSSDEITILQRLAELVSSARTNHHSVDTPRPVETPLAASLVVAAADAPKGEAPDSHFPTGKTAEAQVEKPDRAAAETNPLDHLRAALWDHASELEEQARRAETEQRDEAVPAEAAPEASAPVGAGPAENRRREVLPTEVPPKDLAGFESTAHARAALDEAPADQADDEEEADSDSDSDPQARASSPLHHLSLLLLTLAVLALALGYLLAPVIERHLNSTAETTQTSGSSGTVQAASVTRTPLTPEGLRKLADQGDPEAQFTLGTLYRNGDGVLQDDNKAIEWFQRAADQGHPLALRALGSAYWGGRGVEQNYSRAYFWYELALAMGDQESKSRLEGLSTQMTQRQVADARQQAEAWLQAHNQPPKTASN